MALALGTALVALASAPDRAVALDFRSIDGSGNNILNPDWGKAGTTLLRLGPTTYADGFSTLSGPTRPGARAISNAVVAQPGSLPNSKGVSNMFWQWGQFIDHDLDLVMTRPTEPALIPVPAGDPKFDPGSTGTQTLPFTRSQFDPATGTGPGNPRQQVNVLTSYIDASMVYGSDAGFALSLRTLAGGELKTSAGNLLPTDGLGNFLAGDMRVNEQLGLIAMHTLFVREHNRIAKEIATANPGMSDEDIYQRARRIVAAEVQSITYNEWLPMAIGAGALASYGGYDAGVNAGVANEFAAAAFRLGHTLLPPTLARLNEDGSSIPEGPVALRDAFFQPDKVKNEGGIDPILRGLAATFAQEFDHMIVDDVRNFLFTAVPSGLDLAAANIQRGRDHGIPGYNDMREAMGLARITSFAEIGVFLPDAAARLASIYASVDDIDLWVGALAEIPVAGALMGPLLQAILGDQFGRARDGDRFWYENPDMFTPEEIAMIESRSLSDIIMDNTDMLWMQTSAFVMEPRIPAPGGIALFALGLALLGGLGLRPAITRT